MRSLNVVLKEAAEFLRNGTAIHPGSDLGNDLLVLANARERAKAATVAEQRALGCSCEWPTFIPSPYGHKPDCVFFPVLL